MLHVGPRESARWPGPGATGRGKGKEGRDRGYNPDQDMNAKWPEAWDLVSGTAIKSERLVP